MKTVFLASLIMSVCFSGPVFAEVACEPGFEPLADDALASLLTPLEKKSVVRSRYTQIRVMHLLKNPLRAEGSMIFAPDEGLVWQVEKPISFQLVMTSSFFLQKNSVKESLITAAEQPALFAISTIFADLLGGNMDSVSRHFSIAGRSGINGDWQLCLQPVTEPFLRLMSYIRIEGGNTVHTVHFHDVTSDYTDITFEPDPAGDSLTDVEKAFFIRP